MAMTIIIKDDHGKQVEISVELDDDKKWEGNATRKTRTWVLNAFVIGHE